MSVQTSPRLTPGNLFFSRASRSNPNPLFHAIPSRLLPP